MARDTAEGLRERGRSGNVMVFMVIILPILLIVIGMGVDLSHAFYVGTFQKQCLDDASHEVLVRQEEVKFSSKPDETVRDMVAEALDRDGYIGQIQLTYYEEPKPRTPNSAEDDKRIIVVELAAGRSVGSSFLGGMRWPVTSSVVWTMVPYASYHVFSPYRSNYATSGQTSYSYTHGTRYLLDFTRSETGTGSVHTEQDTSVVPKSKLSAQAQAAFDELM